MEVQRKQSESARSQYPSVAPSSLQYPLNTSAEMLWINYHPQKAQLPSRQSQEIEVCPWTKTPCNIYTPHDIPEPLKFSEIIRKKLPQAPSSGSVKAHFPGGTVLVVELEWWALSVRHLPCWQPGLQGLIPWGLQRLNICQHLHSPGGAVFLSEISQCVHWWAPGTKFLPHFFPQIYEGFLDKIES